jgi:protease-4
MAKLKEFKVREYPEKKGFLESLLNDSKKEIKTDAIKEEIGIEQYDLMMKLKHLKNIIGIPQARLPYDISIR